MSSDTANVNKNESTQTNVNRQTITQLLQTLPASQIASNKVIAERFKSLFSQIHIGQRPDAFYEAEKFHFMKILQDNPALQECTKLSLYGCLMDVAVNGLSFDPSFKHLYLVPFSTKTGVKDGKDVWEKRAQLQISGQGELLLRRMQNQIKYAGNPVLVYEGDEFKYGTKDGKEFIEHVACVPAKSNKIIACYMKITRIDDSEDYKVITQADMDRFRAFSKDKNSKAWVDGIGGMWMSKCIKHAFRNYPKLRTGKFSALQTETIDQQAEVLPAPGTMQMPATIDYSIEEGGDANTETGLQQQPADDDFTKPQLQGEKTVYINKDGNKEDEEESPF